MSEERARSRASVIVLDERKRVLLLHVRDPAAPEREFLLLPGGEIEDGEPAEAAAARELYEETGIVASSLRSAGPRQLEHFSFGGRRYRQTNMLFLLSVESEDVPAAAPAADPHSVGPVWLTHDELLDPPLPVEPRALVDVLRPLLV